MKLVFVIHGLTAGGAERVLVMLANAFVNEGYDVSVIVFSKEDSFYPLDNRVKTIQVNEKKTIKNIFGKVFYNLNRVYKLKQILKEINPDIVIPFMTQMNLYSIVAAKLAKKIVIASEHINIMKNDKTWIGRLRKWIYPYADAVVVLTDYDKEKYDFVHNVYKINNPLVLEDKQKNIKREKIILGVGRLVKAKGFDILLKAFKELNAPEWKLVILGEGPLRSELEKIIGKFNLKESVSMPGLTKDVETYYKKASIYVLSSRIEGFPGVLCEAMGYGCPSIAFDCVSGPSEIIENEKNGILIEAENEIALKYAIQKLIDDEKIRTALGRESVKIRDDLSIDKISKKWLALFQELLKTKVA